MIKSPQNLRNDSTTQQDFSFTGQFQRVLNVFSSLGNRVKRYTLDKLDSLITFIEEKPWAFSELIMWGIVYQLYVRWIYPMSRMFRQKVVGSLLNGLVPNVWYTLASFCILGGRFFAELFFWFQTPGILDKKNRVSLYADVLGKIPVVNWVLPYTATEMPKLDRFFAGILFNIIASWIVAPLFSVLIMNIAPDLLFSISFARYELIRPWWHTVLYYIAAAVIFPVQTYVEEYWFRNPIIKGGWTLLLLQSFLFAWAHRFNPEVARFGWTFMFGYFASALGSSLSVVLTKTIDYSWGDHFYNNFSHCLDSTRPDEVIPGMSQYVHFMDFATPEAAATFWLIASMLKAAQSVVFAVLCKIYDMNREDLLTWIWGSLGHEIAVKKVRSYNEGSKNGNQNGVALKPQSLVADNADSNNARSFINEVKKGPQSLVVDQRGYESW